MNRINTEARLERAWNSPEARRRREREAAVETMSDSRLSLEALKQARAEIYHDECEAAVQQQQLSVRINHLFARRKELEQQIAKLSQPS